MHSQTTACHLRTLSSGSAGLTLTLAERLEESACGFREKTAWFLHNIVTGRPNMNARVRGQFRPQRRLLKSRKHIVPELEVKITTEESALHDEDLASVPTANSGTESPHRALRSAGRIQRNVTGQLVITHGKTTRTYDDGESEHEDFGEPCPMTREFFASSFRLPYHFGLPHLPGLIESVMARLLPTVDEGSEVAF